MSDVPWSLNPSFAYAPLAYYFALSLQSSSSSFTPTQSVNSQVIKEKNGVARACSQTKPLILLREALLISVSHNESMCQTFLILPGEARLSRVMGQFATTVRPARLLSSLFCRRAGEASTVVFVVVGRAPRQRGHIGEWLLLLATIDFSSWCRCSPVLDDGLGALRGGCDPGVMRLRHIVSFVAYCTVTNTNFHWIVFVFLLPPFCPPSPALKKKHLSKEWLTFVDCVWWKCFSSCFVGGKGFNWVLKFRSMNGRNESLGRWWGRWRNAGALFIQDGDVRLRDHRCSIPVCGMVVVRCYACSWCATRVGWSRWYL